MMARKRETFEPMPLTLRPTRLSRDPDDQDWTVHDDGAEIGRLYEDLQTNRPENRWFWSITVMGPARGHMRHRLFLRRISGSGLLCPIFPAACYHKPPVRDIVSKAR